MKRRFTPPVLPGGASVRRPFKLPALLAPKPPPGAGAPAAAAAHAAAPSECTAEVQAPTPLPALALASAAIDSSSEGCEPDAAVEPAAAAAPPKPLKVKLPGLRGCKKKAAPAVAEQQRQLPAAAAPADVAPADTVPDPAPPAAAAASTPAPATTPAPTWVVKRLPVETPESLPAAAPAPRLPAAQELLSRLPLLPVPTASLVPLDDCALGDLGPAAAAVEAGLLPQPVECGLAGSEAVVAALSQQLLRAALAAYPLPPRAVHTSCQLLRHISVRPSTSLLPAPAAAKAAAMPAAKMAPGAAKPAAAMPSPVPAAARMQQHPPATSHLPQMDEATVRRQLGEQAQLSLSYLRRMVFAA